MPDSDHFDGKKRSGRNPVSNTWNLRLPLRLGRRRFARFRCCLMRRRSAGRLGHLRDDEQRDEQSWSERLSCDTFQHDL
jgi:hypothetical protein